MVPHSLSVRSQVLKSGAHEGVKAPGAIDAGEEEEVRSPRGGFGSRGTLQSGSNDASADWELEVLDCFLAVAT